MKDNQTTSCEMLVLNTTQPYYNYWPGKLEIFIGYMELYYKGKKTLIQVN